MIHDIFPKKYSVEYKKTTLEPDDIVFMFDGDNVCCRAEDNNIAFPTFGEFKNADSAEYIYLFSIDKDRYFMPDINLSHSIPVPEGYKWQESGMFRMVGPRHVVFAAVTAQQLYLWYKSTRFCGACGAENAHSETERARVCPKCGLIAYPKISPVVIVAVTNGDHLLVTRYKDRPFRRYALVAGFAEIGESLEDTVRREVLEETGISVKNIRYYKSSPWGFTSTLLSGFYCDLDGDPAIKIDDIELSEAIWIPRDEIPPAESDIALTSEMMERFRTGGEKRSNT